jgi:hypothetical protein
MVTLITSMGRSLRVTADHPVILHTPTGFDIVPALEVGPGDHLMALTELPAVEAPTSLNLIDLLHGICARSRRTCRPKIDPTEQYAKRAACSRRRCALST